jgi:mycothiol synthase
MGSLALRGVAQVKDSGDRLDDESRALLLDAAAAFAVAHGREALPEQVRRSLAQGDDVIHLYDGDPASYAQLRVVDGALEVFGFGGLPAPARLEEARRIATSLDRRLLVWRRGTSDVNGAPPLPNADIERTILKLGRDLPAPPPSQPAGFVVSDFVEGRDEEAWLAVNRDAFDGHPEQAGIDRAALDARLHEQWFDPAGFVLAWHDHDLAGFCWTKRHGSDAANAGEIYAIGVAPRFAGHGLGRALLLEGLSRLDAAGCPTAMLYVEATNVPARTLYRSAGFVTLERDERWTLTPLVP